MPQVLLLLWVWVPMSNVLIFKPILIPEKFILFISLLLPQMHKCIIKVWQHLTGKSRHSPIHYHFFLVLSHTSECICSYSMPYIHKKICMLISSFKKCLRGTSLNGLKCKLEANQLKVHDKYYFIHSMALLFIHVNLCRLTLTYIWNENSLPKHKCRETHTENKQ